MKATVLVKDANAIGGMTRVTPLTERPDGHGFKPFYWDTDQLQLVKSPLVAEELSKFKVGDIVTPKANAKGHMNAKNGDTAQVTGFSEYCGESMLTLRWLSVAYYKQNNGDYPESDFELYLSRDEATEDKVVTKFNVGDKVRITDDLGLYGFKGLEAEVITPVGVGYNDNSSFLRPLTDRPDGHKRTNFWWNFERLELVPEVVEAAPAPTAEGAVRALREAVAHARSVGVEVDCTYMLKTVEVL
jgi:hypothetical protein